ncbi:MAG: ASCH domain-containing protein, partial [Planctomycetota bacterium]
MLLMKKRFFDDIRHGRKKTTLRYLSRRLVRPDTFHNVRGLGRIHVTAVSQVDLADLDDADAQADGLEGLDGLRQALEEIYPPEKRTGRSLYKVEFVYCPPAA